MYNILVVDDEREIRDAINIYLRGENLNVFNASNGIEALEILEEKNVHLIILDIMMPKLDGIKTCLKIRENNNIPIIMLSAKGEDSDKILGLNVGADDYITKPFSLMVLRARVMVALRRLENKNTNTNNKITVDNIILDFDKMEFTKDNNKINLSKTEQKLLKMLITNKGRVLTREQLIDNVWDNDSEFVEENALTVNIKRLREKIEDNKSKPKYIKTVYGIGYIFSEGDKNE